MKLPNAEGAVVDIGKLRDYCLSREHPRGRHKARVFEAVLGLTNDNAPELRDALLAAARDSDAILVEQDAYGTRYIVDLEMSRRFRAATVRSAGIVRAGEDFPRLTSCYVL